MSHKVTLFNNGQTPNPIKVGILLEELGVDYAIVEKELDDGPNGVKGKDFLKINPNGRVPAIIDHSNNDHVVWESAAILLYLGERFDPSKKLVGNTLEERSEVWEWLTFQISGLGPFQGQVFWFKFYHPVKNLDQSVIDRYKNEVLRLFGVYEKRLEEHEWLALDRFTVADIATYTWVTVSPHADLDLSKFPKLSAWHERVKALPSVEKAYAKGQPASLPSESRRQERACTRYISKELRAVLNTSFNPISLIFPSMNDPFKLVCAAMENEPKLL